MEEQAAEVVNAAKTFLALRASKASKEKLNVSEKCVMSYVFLNTRFGWSLFLNER